MFLFFKRISQKLVEQGKFDYKEWKHRNVCTEIGEGLLNYTHIIYMEFWE